MFYNQIRNKPVLVSAGLYVFLGFFSSLTTYAQHSIDLLPSFYDNEFTSNSGDIRGSRMIDKAFQLRYSWRLDANSHAYIMAGLVADQFGTTYNAYVVSTPAEFLLAQGTFMTETINYLFGFGGRFCHPKKYSRLLPEVIAGVEVNAGKGKNNSSGYFAVNTSEGPVIESSYEEIRVRRLNPYLLLGGRYELLQGYKISIPLEFGKRIPLLKPEVYQEHTYRLSGPQLRNARIEKTGEATFIRVGLSLKL